MNITNTQSFNKYIILPLDGAVPNNLVDDYICQASAALMNNYRGPTAKMMGYEQRRDETLKSK